MGALTVAEVRQRVAAGVLALDGYTESRVHGLLFGLDTNSLLHRSFAVITGRYEVQTADQRQRRGEGALVSTPIRVRAAWRIRADAQVSDGDAQLEAEHAVLKAVLAVERTDLHLVFQAADREAAGDGTHILFTIDFRAIHRLTLE